MRRLLTYLGVLLVSCALVGSFASPASAANGQVMVFVADYTEVVVFDNPSGCESLPAGAHVLINMTDEPVSLYGGPGCSGFASEVEPGDGAHVPPFAGSFKVS